MATTAEKPLPPGNGPRPSVVYMTGKSMEDQTIFSLSDQKYRFLQIRELRGKHFWVSSPSGWCLFSDGSYGGKFFLWNPLILAKIRLPSVHIKERGLVPVLFGSPEETDFKVLLFFRSTPLVTVCRVGGRNWREINYSTEFSRCFGDVRVISEDFIGMGNSIGYNGKLYFLSIRPEGKSFIMEGFDSGRIVIQLLDIDKPVLPPYADSEFPEFLVGSDGLIFLVCVWPGVDVEVKAVLAHRLDLPEMRWVKVKSAPHLAFFLAYNSAICCQASQLGIKGNCVYLALEDDNDDSVLVCKYDIGDMTLSVTRPVDVIDEDITHSSPFWIMCDHRLLNQSDEIENDHIVSKEIQVNVHAQERKSRWNKLLEEEGVGKCTKCDFRPDVALAQALGNYLSPVDYLQFRATCRTCRSIFPLDKFKESVPRYLKIDGLPSPFLVFIEPDNLGAYIDPIRGDKYLMTLPPELSGCAIAHSNDGILLMYEYGPDRVFLFNPFAGKLLFTQMGEFYGYSAGFTFNPSSGYSIVSASKFFDEVYVTFACSSEQQVHCYRFLDYSSFLNCDNNPVFYDDAFHFLGDDGVLGVLRPGRNSFDWNVHQPSKMPSSYKQKFLLECGGALLSVFVSFHHRRVRVYRWNQSNSTWVKVRNLGNHMIYVSNSSSFAMVARGHGMENKVYFPRLCGQSIVFYSLHTKRFHTFESRDLEIDVYDTRELLRSCWITPIWS